MTSQIFLSCMIAEIQYFSNTLGLYRIFHEAITLSYRYFGRSTIIWWWCCKWQSGFLLLEQSSQPFTKVLLFFYVSIRIQESCGVTDLSSVPFLSPIYGFFFFPSFWDIISIYDAYSQWLLFIIILRYKTKWFWCK